MARQATEAAALLLLVAGAGGSPSGTSATPVEWDQVAMPARVAYRM
jgi:hypothetical protein